MNEGVFFSHLHRNFHIGKPFGLHLQCNLIWFSKSWKKLFEWTVYSPKTVVWGQQHNHKSVANFMNGTGWKKVWKVMKFPHFLDEGLQFFTSNYFSLEIHLNWLFTKSWKIWTWNKMVAFKSGESLQFALKWLSSLVLYFAEIMHTCNLGSTSSTFSPDILIQPVNQKISYLQSSRHNSIEVKVHQVQTRSAISVLSCLGSKSTVLFLKQCSIE